MLKVFCNLTMFLYGYIFNYYQDAIGMYSLDKAIDYYGEIHTSQLNKVMHGIFMPLAVYGLLLSMPIILDLDKLDASILRVWIFYFYFGLYCQIDIFYAILFAITYYYPLKFANIDYKKNAFTLMNGLIILSYSLFIQEYVGHYLGGDKFSRPEGLLNAILYAPYFGTKELFLFIMNPF